MSLAPETIARIIDHIEVWYPDWTGIQDPRFQQNEIGYKREAIAKRDADREIERESSRDWRERG